MKKITQSFLLSLVFIFVASMQAMAVETLYKETFSPGTATFTEQSANDTNYYFVHSYDFSEDIAGKNVESLKLTLLFSDYDDINVKNNNDEDWYAQVWIGSTQNIYDYGDPMDGLNLTDYNLLYELNNVSRGTEITFDSSASWFSDVVDSGIFTLALLESTHFKDNFTLNSAKLEILGSTAAVPIPGAALLLGSGLLGIVAVRRRGTV